MQDHSLQTNFNSCLETPARYRKQPGHGTQCSRLVTREDGAQLGLNGPGGLFQPKLFCLKTTFNESRVWETPKVTPVLSLGSLPILTNRQYIPQHAVISINTCIILLKLGCEAKLNSTHLQHPKTILHRKLNIANC